MQKKIWFKNKRGERLGGVLHIPRTWKQKSGIVVCHGYNDGKDHFFHKDICKKAAQAGMMALRFDFSGQGESEGNFEKMTYTRYLSDVKSAIDVLDKKGVKKIGLVGWSMGGALASLTATRDKRVWACIGIAPVSKIYQTHYRIWKEQNRKTGKNYLLVKDINNPKVIYKIGKTFINDAKKYDLLKEAPQIYQPTCYIIGGRDPVIKKEEVKAVYNRIGCDAKEYHVLSKADHLFTGHEKKLVNLSVGFCKKYLTRETSHIIVAALKHKDKILILKRSSKVSYYPGYWHIVAGYINDNDPLRQAYSEIEEETGFKKKQLKLLAQSKKYQSQKDSFLSQHTWIVHPFMFETNSSKVKLDWEHTEYRWINPEDFPKHRHVPLMDETIQELWGKAQGEDLSILLIDTSEFNLVRLYLKKSDKILKFEETIGSRERDTLLELISDWLQKNKVLVNYLNAVVVVRGPGPFTSVRVGVTIANTLSWSLKKPLYGFKKDKHFIPEKALQSISQKKVNSEKFVKPFYSQPPNITKPKNAR